MAEKDKEIGFVSTISLIRKMVRMVQCKGKTPDAEELTLVDNFYIELEPIPDKNAEVPIPRLHVNAIDKMQSVYVDFSMYKRDEGGLTEINGSGKMPIKSTEEFISYLNRYEPEDEVEVTYNGKQIFISKIDGTKTSCIPVGSKSSIKSHIGVKDLPFEWRDDKPYFTDIPDGEEPIPLDCILKLDTAVVKSVIDDGDVVEMRIYPFLVEKDKCTITVGESKSGYISTELDAEVNNPYDEVRSVYAYGMDNIFGNLSGEIEIFMNNDMHCWIVKQTKDYRVNFMLVSADIEGGEKENE